MASLQVSTTRGHFRFLLYLSYIPDIGTAHRRNIIWASEYMQEWWTTAEGETVQMATNQATPWSAR